MTERTGRLAAVEAWMLRGSGSGFTLALVAFVAAMGVVSLANGAPRDRVETWMPLLASCALAFMFVGTQTRSRLVQRLGLALFAAWVVTLPASCLG